MCWDPGSNWGPFALQANALPTELSQHIVTHVDGTLLIMLYMILSYICTLFNLLSKNYGAGLADSFGVCLIPSIIVLNTFVSGKLSLNWE